MTTSQSREGRDLDILLKYTKNILIHNVLKIKNTDLQMLLTPEPGNTKSFPNCLYNPLPQLGIHLTECKNASDWNLSLTEMSLEMSFSLPASAIWEGQ